MKVYYRIREYMDGIGDCRVFESFQEALDALGEMFQDEGTSKNLYFRIERIGDIRDLVKTYEDACRILGIKPMEATSMCTYNRLDAKYHFESDLPNHVEALLQLETITKALNEGWKPDWEDKNQRKWIVEISSDGETNPGYYGGRHSGYPSSLYLKSKELAEYAGERFADLYKQLLVM